MHQDCCSLLNHLSECFYLWTGATGTSGRGRNTRSTRVLEAWDIPVEVTEHNNRLSIFANFFLSVSHVSARLWLCNIYGRYTVISSFKDNYIYDNSLWYTLHIKDTPNIRTFLFQVVTSARFPACVPNLPSTTQAILSARERAAAKAELLLISMELALISITAYNLSSLIQADTSRIVWSLCTKHLSVQAPRSPYHFRSPLWMALLPPDHLQRRTRPSLAPESVSVIWLRVTHTHSSQVTVTSVNDVKYKLPKAV